MTHSQLALEDLEALYLGSPFLMADPMGPLLDQDEEEALSPSSSLEVKAPASPSLSFSSYASSSSPYHAMPLSPLASSSPPPSPPLTQSSSFLGTKAETDLLSMSLLAASDLLNAHVGADNSEDAFEDLDWMTEKIDLNEFDLESLIGTCSSEESPSFPEGFLSSLDSQMDLDLDSFVPTAPIHPSSPDVDLVLPDAPSLHMETPVSPKVKTEEVAPVQEVVKSEPPSPVTSPSPSSPAYTLELGSEVDILDVEKMATSITTAVIQEPSEILQTTTPIVLSIPAAGHLVVVLANKEEPSFIPLPDQSNIFSSSDSDSDSGIESGAGSPTRHSTPPSSPTPGSSRTKPYCKPQPTASPSPKASRVKSVSGTPRVVEKKLKKMEQNKTAATRYRQKKRVEQESLNVECDELEKKNHELKEKAESISREIQYLKDLMEEVRKHRRGKTPSVA
ncbi:cyclic AMP-dependent transcription factor ATF-4 isoform X2 [Kryptolebias marmoratus]|uniref:Cyclic AMP-dependent transcription factor ATF-4 n=1 Tax=Kryptolebias marmoratus TaxID=37003 RepID=A0A3Q3AT42_KRYMA|nr:cyclic AMP-dependent transcription factor ATF-4 isoform X2 [Kryptolebias marmoratus]